MGAYTPTTQPRMRTDEDAMRPCAHTMHARMTHSAHACECNKHPQPEPQQDAPTLALRDSCCSNTALHYAAIYGHGDVVALLLSHGAAVNKQANDGYANRTSMPAAMRAHTGACAHRRTALHDAANKMEIVYMLFEAGADPSIKNNDGHGPLRAHHANITHAT